MITGDTVNELYIKTLEKILSEGVSVAPRGLPTREVRTEILCLTQPCKRVVLSPLRRVSPGFLCAEALWILAGTAAPWIFDFNSQLLQYTDDGVLHGAYGPRLRQWAGHIDQFELVLHLLQRDQTSRQATMVIFDPSKDFQPKRDVPCTNMFRFLVRDGRLDMTTIMRSQDAWLGLPYDIFNCTVLHEVFAGFLDVEVGRYYHFVDSLHLYERDATKAQGVVENPQSFLEIPRALSARVEWPEFDALLRFIIEHAVERPDAAALQDISSDWWRSLGWGLLLHKKYKTNRQEAVSMLHHIQDPHLSAAFAVWWGARAG